MAQTTKAQTIADIARLAGVSKSTVSRALNDSPLIGAETKERIHAIAREHHFSMNEQARRLSLRHSNVIGLVRFDWGHKLKAFDMFMLEILGGISTGLAELGYELLVLQASVDDQDWARRALDAGRADGFVLIHPAWTPEQLGARARDGVPLVVWGSPPKSGGYSTVSGDSLSGGRLATEHLLAIGRRRIAFVGGPTGSLEVMERRRGYEETLREAGIEIDPNLIVHHSWMHAERSGAEEAVKLLELDPPVDAIFACSDMAALGAMEAIRDSGRTIPDDVAVVGYDDIAVAAYSNPPLTTIRQDGPLVGTLLARALVQQLQTGAVTNVSLPAELVVRESA